MPRPPRGSWDRRRGVYVAALGDWFVDNGGRRRRRSVTLTYPDGLPVRRYDEVGRIEAIARLIRRNAERDAMAVNPSLSGLFQGYVDWHRTIGSADTTIVQYRKLANLIRVVPFGNGQELGGVPAADVGVEHLMALRAEFRRRGARPGYIRTVERALISCVRWAAQAVEGRDPLVILPRNPFPRDGVRGLPVARSDRECPTWEGLQAILDAVDAYAATIAGKGVGPKNRDHVRVRALQLRVVGERGCRPLEVCRLRVEHWDDGPPAGFNLSKHKTAHRGVVGVIPLNDATADRVRALINRPDRKGPWVFAPWNAEAEGPPGEGTLRSWWKDIRGKIGVPGAERYELYSFRNTVSNKLRLAGVEGRGMQLALRHTTGIADTVYRRDRIEEAARIFERAGL